MVMNFVANNLLHTLGRVSGSLGVWDKLGGWGKGFTKPVKFTLKDAELYRNEIKTFFKENYEPNPPLRPPTTLSQIINCEIRWWH